MPSPVILSWTLHAPVDRATAWRMMSDTDTFNRVAGLGFSFDETPLPDGSVQRTGRVSKFGLVVEWEELPFDFVAPDGFVARRVYRGGPLRESQVTVQLEESPEGTRIHYEVQLLARSLFSRPLVAADARLTIKPTLTRALEAAVQALCGEGPGLDPSPPLDDQQEARLASLLEGVAHPTLRQALGDRVRRAPLPVVDRLQPLQVAQATGVDPTTTVHSFLEATRAGLLEMRWEMLCPRCRVGKASVRTLSASSTTVHCTSCNIRYDGSFPDNVAVVFRPDPRVREVDVPVDCLLSPQRTPHVLAQAIVADHGTITWDVALESGGYRLDLAQGSAMVEVVRGAPDHDLVVDIETFGVQPGVLRVAPGRHRLTVRNRTEARIAVGLHRQWRPPFTLTAGALLSLPGARKLLPPDAISPGAEPVVRRRVVVAATDPRALPGEGLVGELSSLAEAADVAHVGNQAVVAAFDEVAPALAWLVDDAGLSLAVGVAVGPVVELRADDGALLGGVPVEQALDAMRDVGAAEIAVHAASKDDETLRAAIDGSLRLVQREPGTFCHLYLTVPHRQQEALQRLHARMDAYDVPSLVHGWVIGAPVAEGGQGRLFDARGPDEERGVLKLLRPELATDVEACQRLALEAELAASITHDAVVKVHDHGQLQDGRLYLIMERLEGADLRARIDTEALTPDEARALCVRLCDGLQAIHDAGVLHRDLKPANVFLVDGDMARAKVVDFGIAQRLESTPASDPFDVVLGTVEYMSPEQLQLDPIDHRSDLYALGLVIYESVAGQLPWTGELEVQVAMQRLVKPAPRPEGVTDALWDAIDAVLAIDPAERPADARALGERLADTT